MFETLRRLFKHEERSVPPTPLGPYDYYQDWALKSADEQWEAWGYPPIQTLIAKRMETPAGKEFARWRDEAFRNRLLQARHEIDQIFRTLYANPFLR